MADWLIVLQDVCSRLREDTVFVQDFELACIVPWLLFAMYTTLLFVIGAFCRVIHIGRTITQLHANA